MNIEAMAACEGSSALALSVIQQALRDATAARPNEHALAFLTDTTGSWAEAFEAWCGVADLQPDWARDRCRVALSEMISATKAKRKAA